MAEFKGDTGSRINTVTEPGVTSARPAQFQAPPGKYVGSAAEDLTKLVGPVVEGVKNAYQGYAQAELVGGETASDFVDQDTIDELFGDGKPDMDKLLDEELDLTTITALRKQGRISATTATLLARRSVKRVSNEFPGISQQLRRRGANYFQTLGGRSVLENTAAEDAQIAADTRYRNQINDTALKMGYGANVPFETKEQLVTMQNEVINDIDMLTKVDAGNRIKAKQIMGNLLSHNSTLQLTEMMTMADDPDIDASGLKLQLESRVNAIRQQLNMVNQKMGLPLSKESIEGYMSAFEAQSKMLQDYKSNKATRDQVVNRMQTLDAYSMIDLHNSGMTKGVREAMNLVSGFGRAMNNIPGPQATQIMNMVNKAGTYAMNVASGAAASGASGLGDDATSLNSETADNVATVLDVTSSAPSEGENAESKKAREDIAKWSFEWLSEKMALGTDLVGTEEWEELLGFPEKTSFLNLDIDDRSKKLFLEALQKDYEIKVHNAWQSAMNRPLTIENDDGSSSTISTRQAFKLTTNGIVFNLELDPANTVGLSRPSLNQLETSRQIMEKTYIPRINRIVRAVAHLEGHTDYAKVVGKIGKQLESQVKFDRSLQPVPQTPRVLSTDPETGELIIEKTHVPIPGVVTPKKGDRGMPPTPAFRSPSGEEPDTGEPKLGDRGMPPTPAFRQ